MVKMTLEDIQKEKKKLEETISKMLSDFQKKHNVQVEDIDLIVNTVSRTTDNYLVIGDVQAFIKIILYKRRNNGNVYW